MTKATVYQVVKHLARWALFFGLLVVALCSFLSREIGYTDCGLMSIFAYSPGPHLLIYFGLLASALVTVVALAERPKARILAAANDQITCAPAVPHSLMRGLVTNSVHFALAFLFVTASFIFIVGTLSGRIYWEAIKILSGLSHGEPGSCLLIAMMAGSIVLAVQERGLYLVIKHGSRLAVIYGVVVAASFTAGTVRGEIHPLSMLGILESSDFLQYLYCANWARAFLCVALVGASLWYWIERWNARENQSVDSVGH